MRETARLRSSGYALSTAAATERVAVGDTALQHRLVRRDFLTGDGEAVVVEEAERRKIGGGECTVGHVEVFRMASVGTSIIGRPRPRLRDRHAADSSGGRYTLKHDEPIILSAVLSRAEQSWTQPNPQQTHLTRFQRQMGWLRRESRIMDP
jgi:hypothetical protein